MRRLRFIGLTGVLLGAAAGGALVAFNASGDTTSSGRDKEWTGFASARYGLSGALPTGWRLSSRTQTPQLNDPREIVTAATFGLGSPEPGCNMLPIAAVRAMRPTDALVSVQERGNAVPVGDFPARPARFSAVETPGTAQLLEQCLGAPLRARASWTQFSDGARAFHALVVVGADADKPTDAEAFAILDRLRFDREFRPTWDFAG